MNEPSAPPLNLHLSPSTPADIGDDGLETSTFDRGGTGGAARGFSNVVSPPWGYLYPAAAGDIGVEVEEREGDAKGGGEDD